MQRGSEENAHRLVRSRPWENSPGHSVSEKKAPRGSRWEGAELPVLGGREPARLSPLHPHRKPGALLLSSAPGWGVCLPERRCREGLFSREKSWGAEDRWTLTRPVPGPVCAVPPRRPQGPQFSGGLGPPPAQQGRDPRTPRHASHTLASSPLCQQNEDLALSCLHLAPQPRKGV